MFKKKFHHILIVDDNRSAARALAKLLTKDGYKVDIAHDGEGAIKAAHIVDPDAIILDMNLPVKNGYEVARVLKKNHSRALLIALTGVYGTEEHRTLAREVGFDHYLTRPVLAIEIEKLFPV
jgi:DNA-binding response OmpR family regulator